LIGLNTSLTWLSHFGFGATAGTVYAALASRIHLQPVAKGVTYGLAVFLGSYEELLPRLDNPSCYLGTRLRENRSGNRLLHHRLPSRRGKVAT